MEDCVAGSSLEAHESAPRAMEYLQTGARVSLDEVLDSLENHADYPVLPDAPQSPRYN